MKKFLLFSLLAIGTLPSFSQSLSDINSLMDKKKYADAKTGIDKFLADSKNAASPEGWYYKGRVYNSLSHDPATSPADAFSYKVQAFDAFQKNQQLDSKDVRLFSEQYRSYLDLYGGFYDLGVADFNKKDYVSALVAFKKAQDVENYILAKNYTYGDFKMNKVDTSLVINLASASFQTLDTTGGIGYYRKITDADITGKDYREIYELLANYYSDKKDDANLQGILAKGKAAYPDDKYWNELEMDQLSKSGNKEAMFAKYDELFKKDPNDFANTYNYAAELFNSIYGKDATPADQAKKDKLTELLKAAIPNDPKIDAAMLMFNHLFNDAAAYSSDAALVKGTKPDDVKKKKDLTALSIAKLDEAAPYGQKVVDYFSKIAAPTMRQKADYRTTAETMSDLYSAKGDQKKSAEFDKIKDSIKFN